MKYPMFSIIKSIFIFIFIEVRTQNITSNMTEKNFTVNQFTEKLMSMLGVNLNENERVKELEAKLNKIDNYVINKEEYMTLLKKQVVDDTLNETNFFDALYSNERYLLKNETRSLYLKLKEKMNRDDILEVAKDSPRTARKMGGLERSEHDVERAVDEFIGHVATDNHRFEVGEGGSSYWDPQGELEDLKEYHKHDARRIYQGERSSIRHYPFMVSVQVMGRFWCGGALYWYDLVLTSASCLQLMHNNRFYRENPRVLSVRIGSNHSRIGGEVVEASEVYFQPGYNPRTLNHNIAVIRLQRQVKIKKKRRVPKLIEISKNAMGVPSTAEILLLGWGVIGNTQKLSYEPIFLQKKFLPVYPNKFCKEVYGDKFITKYMFCVGTMSTGEGACNHDAGGPAVMSGKLYGIISFGPTICGYPNAPTVLTLVGAYADWIKHINDSMPPYYRGRKHTTTTESWHMDIMEPQTHRVFESESPLMMRNSPIPPAKKPVLRANNRLTESEPEIGWSIE